MEAAGEREKRQCLFQAAMTANLMNCWSSKHITAEKLLGIEQVNQSFADASPEKQSQMLDELKARLEQGRVDGEQAASAT